MLAITGGKSSGVSTTGAAMDGVTNWAKTLDDKMRLISSSGVGSNDCLCSVKEKLSEQSSRASCISS